MLAAVPATPLGTKRIVSLARSSSALASLTVPTSVQLAPASVRYCQTPLPEARPVMAMPCSAPLLVSEMLLPTKLATVCPALSVSFSVMAVSAGDSADSTGAALGTMILSVSVWGSAKLLALLISSASIVIVTSPVAPAAEV